jgi:PKD repeat protein
MNVSPSLSSLTFTPSSVTDHQTLSVSGTFSDPGATDTFTVVVNWGDGTSSSQALGASARSYSASHQYAAAGTYDVMVTVTDRDGGSGSMTASVFVSARNTAPSGLVVTPLATGANLELTGSFTDPDPLDTHTVAVSWGDGDTTTQSLAAGSTAIDTAHVYAASGTYTLNVTVTDSAGASTSTTRQVVITVPVVTAEDILDQMSALILGFGLDRNTERWMLKRVDDIRASLVYGNGQVCGSSGTLAHLMSFAQRNLASDQYAALNVLSGKLQVAAGCSVIVVRATPSGNVVAGVSAPPTKPTTKRSGGHEPL